MYTTLTVDLANPPADRWPLTPQQREQGQLLVEVYNRDLGVDPEMLADITDIAGDIVAAPLLAEMVTIADTFGVGAGDVLLANLHYDILKHLVGCSAFAVDHPKGPLHARNLDWWTPSRALHDAAMVTRFVRGPEGDFLTVGWPGLVGAYSGMAPGRFAITLNSVESRARPEVATPVVMLIRDVLESSGDYATAVQRLAETTIACDCLLLVTGTRPGETVVLERSPSSVAYRRPVAGAPVAVTNDYLALDAETAEATTELMRTSCDRYERLEELLDDPPRELDGCIDLLGDCRLMMGITVQQMAFQASTGEFVVVVPPDYVTSP